MAQGDKKKKSNGGGGQAAPKATAEKAESARMSADDKVESAKRGAVSEQNAVSARAARPSHGEAHHGEAGAHGAHGAHGHAPNRREYFIVFVVLFVLTVLEVVVAQIPGIGKTALGVTLVGMALAKAAIVGLFYMHLKHETRILRIGVAIPLAAPALYAFVLIAEAAWRWR